MRDKVGSPLETREIVLLWEESRECRCSATMDLSHFPWPDIRMELQTKRKPLPYRLGCPGWACDDWVGSFYTTSNRQRWLEQYASVFNAVEGNSTFYGLPSLETARRWAESTASPASPASADGPPHTDFQFVLKFPSVITHDKQLRGAERETHEFLEVLRVIKEVGRLGPAFIQLPPFFSGRQLPDLEAFLRQLPSGLHYSVETRHDDYFDQGPVERDFTQLLTAMGVDRMLFDSRPLFSAPASDELERIGQSRKPQSPVRQTVTAQRPVLRLINRNDIPSNLPWMTQWADIAAGWLEQGLTPYIFTHAADNQFAPQAALQFHNLLRERVPELPELPKFPAARIEKQQSLF